VLLRSAMTAALLVGAMGAVGTPGCTIQPLGSDAGTGGGGTTTQTVGDECAALATAFCTHVIDDCGVADSLADCLSTESPTCCSVPSDCDAISETTSGELDACTSEIAQQDCASATADGIADLPSCQGIPVRP
jgi:hypothetical protein